MSNEDYYQSYEATEKILEKIKMRVDEITNVLKERKIVVLNSGQDLENIS